MENELPKRKRLRLDGFDYNSPGAYFVTICTHNRINIFSRIEPSNNELKLSEYGQIVDWYINNIPERYGIQIENYVIMPNHIHLLVLIAEREIRESPLQSRSVLSKFVGYIKMNATKQIHASGNNKNVWQRGYHDHIVRNREDFQNIFNYICVNPDRWETDCLYTKHE